MILSFFERSAKTAANPHASLLATGAAAVQLFPTADVAVTNALRSRYEFVH